MIARVITQAGDISRYALDDAQIPVSAVSKRAQRVLVRGAVVRGDGLREAGKLDDDDAFLEPVFVNTRRQTSRRDASRDRRAARAPAAADR